MSATLGGPLRKAAPKVFKSSLETPLSLRWPEVCPSDADAVKSHLTRYLEGCNRARKSTRPAKSEAQTAARQTKSEAKSSSVRPVKPDAKSSAARPARPDARLSARPVRSEAQATPVESTASAASAAAADAVCQSLAVGVNECTRCLERDDLSLLLVCRSCPLPTLSRHLLPLAATRACLAGAVPGLSEHVSPLLGVKRAMAIGIKRGAASQSCAAVDDLVASISTKLPRVAVPWLREVEVDKAAAQEERDTEAPPAKKAKKEPRRPRVSLKTSKPPALKFLGLAVKTRESDPKRQTMKAQRKQLRRQRQAQRQAGAEPESKSGTPSRSGTPSKLNVKSEEPASD